MSEAVLKEMIKVRENLNDWISIITAYPESYINEALDSITYELADDISSLVTAQMALFEKKSQLEAEAYYEKNKKAPASVLEDIA